MTRKDYDRAAIMVHTTYRRDPAHKKIITNFLVAFFYSDNPRFDEEKFRAMCGGR